MYLQDPYTATIILCLYKPVGTDMGVSADLAWQSVWCVGMGWAWGCGEEHCNYGNRSTFKKF